MVKRLALVGGRIEQINYRKDETMARGQLRPKATAEDLTIEQVPELTEDQVVAMIRQSSTKQVRENVESADLQLTGAQRFAVRQGLDADKIVIAWEGEGKRGVSGTLRIDQRERLQETMAGIYAGRVKLVWAYSVSRLFRDKYGVQVGTFMEACAKHGVKVVIETATTFDFNNSFHVMMFQMLANVAAKENEDRTRLLHEARGNKARRGEYDGRPARVGFIVDRDKESPTYGKLIPYEPHAEVVERLYRRYRDLGGEFNMLKREVAKMKVVFPPFEPWVDPKDVSKLQLIKVCAVHGQDREERYRDASGNMRYRHVGCEFKGEECRFIGYHITKVGLFNLLTAVEYAGYWKTDGQLLVDENGLPVKNHDAIVDLSDWYYAFNRLSFEKLDGTPNTERSTRTHRGATYKGKDTKIKALLHGLLTSPLGTVQYSGGWYLLSVRQEGKPHRKMTLMLRASLVDIMFLEALAQRYGRHHDVIEQLWKKLTEVRARNAKALVSVDEQIANYEKEIANKQAVLSTLGATMDRQTMIQYNEDIKGARANIAALEAKKNAATVDESKLVELANKFQIATEGNIFSPIDLIKNLDLVRLFIQLAADKIEINEYSAHFATLTVYWSAPFQQVDRGYIWLAKGNHETWTKEDEDDLARLYPHADRKTLLERFSTRSWACLSTHAGVLGVQRETRLNTSEIKNRFWSLLDMEVIRKLDIEPWREGWYESAKMWEYAVNEDMDSTSYDEDFE